MADSKETMTDPWNDAIEAAAKVAANAWGDSIDIAEEILALARPAEPARKCVCTRLGECDGWCEAPPREGALDEKALKAAVSELSLWTNSRNLKGAAEAVIRTYLAALPPSPAPREGALDRVRNVLEGMSILVSDDVIEDIISAALPPSRSLEPWNPATSPGMTDMMIPAESLDAFMEANPLPPEPAGAVTDDDIYEQGWRAGQEAAATELAKLRQALEYALHAIDTGKSEPLFAAQDLIRNTLQGGPDDN